MIQKSYHYIRSNRKNISSSIGSILSIAGIFFLAFRLYLYKNTLDFSHIDKYQFFILALFALVIGTANLMLALGWLNLLKLFGVFVSKKWAITAYGISQLAKYVPGNIFNLVSRQAIGMAAGIPAWSLLKSSAWEIGLITIAGITVGSLALPLAFHAISSLFGFLLSIISLTIVLIVFNLFIGKAAAVAFFWQIGFFICSGAIYVNIIALVTQSHLDQKIDWTLTLGACVLAWVIGLVTPGAPAGVGVRELVLLSLLGGQVAQADLLLAIVLGRMVTVTGDLLFFLSAYALKSKKAGHDSNQYN